MKSRETVPPAALLTLALLACGAEPGGAAPQDPSPGAPPRPVLPAAGERLLEIDGITVTFGDVAPAMAFLDRLAPERSLRHKLRAVLDELVLPLLFARREFGKERAALLERARELSAAVGNVAELEARSEGLDHRVRKSVTPMAVEIPIARFLFDPLKVGSVSGPIEVPQGFVVAGAFDLQEHQLVSLDRCDALQVGFVTHRANAWGAWLADLRARIGDRVTYCHPEYRRAVPPWLHVP